MPQNIYRWILKIGVFFSFLIVLFTFKSLLFPFITSKQIPFNILIEVLFVFWVAFLFKYPEYKPKWSYISFGMVAFFSVLTLSCFTGVDFNLSFWGDIERMLGVFHLLHFLVLYFIVITVFRDWNDWKWLFIISLICSAIVSLNGLSGKAYSTIGNTAYVSGYLIFNMYFAVLLFYRERKSDFKWLYLIAIPVLFLAFQKANTTGAWVGFGFSGIMAVFMYAVLSKNKKIKRATLATFFLTVVIVGGLFINRESDFVKKNFTVIYSIDIQKDTFQTRLISWRAALKDIPNNPILGTGHGNYAIIFDRHFEPTFYDFTRTETYFDRAHNNLIDILATSGILGLVAYLSIFIAVTYYLIKGYREGKFDTHHFVIVTSLFIGYFVQNLAVFDSYVTYTAVMILLAYVYFVYNLESETLIEKISEKSKDTKNLLTKDRDFDNREMFSFIITGIIMLTILYQFNVKPLEMLIGTIDGQRVWASSQDLNLVTEEYKKALSHNSVLDRDSITSYVRVVSSAQSSLSKMTEDERNKILDYAIELAQFNVDYNKGDSLNQMMLAQILNTAAGFNRENQEKFEYYSNRSLEAIDDSINASPKRIPIYYQKAQIYITRGEQEKALETLGYAEGLNENYYDSFCHLGKTLYYFGEKEKMYEHIDRCVDLGGAAMLLEGNLVNEVLEHYNSQKDLDRVLKIFTAGKQANGGKVEYWVSLAKIYKQMGDTEKAREAVDEAIKLDPKVEQYADSFLNDL